MSNKESPSQNKGIVLSANDQALLVSVFKSSEQELKPNFQTLAKDCGFANANSARTQWHRVRHKLLGTQPNPTASKSPKKASGNSPKKPSGVTKKTPPRKKKTISRYITPAEDSEGEDEADEVKMKGGDDEDEEEDYGEKIKYEGDDEDD